MNSWGKTSNEWDKEELLKNNAVDKLKFMFQQEASILKRCISGKCIKNSRANSEEWDKIKCKRRWLM